MDVGEGGVSFQFPYWKPLRRRLRPDDPLFAAGNIERELLEKQVALNMTEEEKQHIRSFEDWESGTAFCPIVGCGSRLKSLVDFEDHYNARHTASCSVCSRVYPTSRLLSIHVSEAHDSFFQAKVARGCAMYECLVEGCGVKLKSYKNRQQHLVDKHKFPSSFEFFKKANPSKKHRQNAKRKQSLSNTGDDSTAMQVEKEEDMEELISGVSRLSTSDSPLTISFGRRRNHGLGFVPRGPSERENARSSRKMTDNLN